MQIRFLLPRCNGGSAWLKGVNDDQNENTPNTQRSGNAPNTQTVAALIFVEHTQRL